MEFHKNRNLQIVSGIDDNNSTYLEGNTRSTLENAMTISTLPVDIMLWHRQFGHHHYTGINEAITRKLVTGITLQSQKLQDPVCELCLARKMHAKPFPVLSNCMSNPLELIHSDVQDINHNTFTGYRYWVTFIDNFSQYKFVFPIKKKSEVFQAFKNFKAYAKNQSGHHVKALHDDKGGEYMSNEFHQLMTSCRIACQHTTRNCPQQNRVSEQVN